MRRRAIDAERDPEPRAVKIPRPDPPETRLLASVDATPPRPPRRAPYCRRDPVIVSGRMPARSKRSLAQLGKHGAKKLKVHHPDEAPAPATERGRYGWPAPVAADAPPPSAHGPVRYARPPALYESVCALSPTELMYHLYECWLCLVSGKPCWVLVSYRLVERVPVCITSLYSYVGAFHWLCKAPTQSYVPGYVWPKALCVKQAL